MQGPAIRRAVVVGTGLMGPGIAYTLAVAGCQVVLCGRSPESVERGLRSLGSAVATLVDGECLVTVEGDAVLGRVVGSTDLPAAAAPADLVIESIVEDLAAKQALFAELEKTVRPDAILASNTSGLPATQLASVLENPERFAVAHFWNPPHLMPLVEIVRGERTSAQTVETLVELLRAGRHQPVVVNKDTPGQLGNRLFHALIREAIHVVEEGIASAEDVDLAVKTGLGLRFPVLGVLEHLDNVGLGTVFAIQSYMCEALCNEPTPSGLLREKVTTGQVGVKAGRGFYDWSAKDNAALLKARDAFLIERLKATRSDRQQ